MARMEGELDEDVRTVAAEAELMMREIEIGDVEYRGRDEYSFLYLRLLYPV